MRLSHRFKVASKKKGGMAACRRRYCWIKKYCGYIESTIDETNRREIPEPIAEPLPAVGVDHGGYQSPEVLDLNCYPLLKGEVVLHVEPKLSLQSFLKTLPAPPTAPLLPKHERYISMGCVKDVLNVSEPAKKTVTQKMAGFITSLTNRVRGVFNA
jgi:hypothetical protein